MNKEEKLGKQLAIFNETQKWEKIYKTAGMPVKVLISRTAQLYYSVQNIKNRILRRPADEPKALPSGMEQPRGNIREELYKEEYTKQADAKSAEYRTNVQNNEQIKEEEPVQESR